MTEHAVAAENQNVHGRGAATLARINNIRA